MQSCGVAKNGARLVVLLAVLNFSAPADATEDRFEGKFISGRGDADYLQLLDTGRRMFAPDPEFQNLSMLYFTNWNGLVEGPTWDAWWIQNSYGTSYASLPFLQEPFVTFLQNSQDLWFDQMGDGKRVGSPPPFNWVAPDGCLCDCAQPGRIVYRQGDGRIGIHDWAMEFTAAGMVLQSELLLISHDLEKAKKYLPKLERSAAFIETRRDTNNLFLAGPAGNLLAPSYAGWKKPDGTYGKAYLTGLSITYIAALDRLIELEKFAGREDRVRLYQADRGSARKALSLLTTDEGYFIRSLDPDGVKHGVFGAAQHGYLEASPNHDAIAFGIVDQAQAEKIYRKMASIPQLRPHQFILPNYPSYDDTYEDKLDGIWSYGTWVNGGEWGTCEARMILGYYRLGKFEDARRSMRQLMKFAEAFRMDNPLVNCGDDVYQPTLPINLTYDAFGPPAALIRGLFEYDYRADGLTLHPHIPPGITELEQKFPIRFGAKQILISTVGSGPISRVQINGQKWKRHDKDSIDLPYQKLPQTARIRILLGQGKPSPDIRSTSITGQEPVTPQVAKLPVGLENLEAHGQQAKQFFASMRAAGLENTYEAAHARLFLEAANVIAERQQLLSAGKLHKLPAAASQAAADKSYSETARNLWDGLERTIQSYDKSDSPERRKIFGFWKNSF